MKIVIIGGHLTPALSVIEALPKDADILYVGRKHGLEGDRGVSLEYETITKKNIAFENIKTGRLQRSFTRRTIPSFAKIPVGLGRSLLVLRKFKPDVVVGFGGYVSVPVILAAKILRIPIVIHEQTMEVGFANKIVSKFADKVCVSFDTSFKYFPKEKTVLTGNPIRKSILRPAKKFEIPNTSPVIFITGGSLGSHVINVLVEKSLTALLDKYIVVHQTGAATEFKDYDKLSILKQGLNNNKRNRYIFSKYFSPEEIGSILKQASLVVARAGINTVSELIVLQKPALLIPLPISQKNEQRKNAELLKRLSLGEVVEQKDLTPENFLFEINTMMSEIDKYKLNSDKSHISSNSARRIVEIIYASAKNNN